jgi:hypothetical protein
MKNASSHQRPPKSAILRRRHGISSGKLYLSFWHVCLENFPEATFVHRRITPNEAKRRIERAQKQEALLCLSRDDLLAPYRQHQRENHDTLCKVLKKHFDIALTLRDFTSRDGDGKDASYFINPLNCCQIHGKDQLLIVNCAFGLRKRRHNTLAFDIWPTTVTFHVVEVAPKSRSQAIG